MALWPSTNLTNTTMRLLYLTIIALAMCACSATRVATPISKQSKAATATLLTTTPSEWEFVGSVDLKFDTYHPQGMVKVGDSFYITSVKVERRPRYSRNGKQITVQDEGAGKGYLMQFDAEGNLLDKIEVCEGTMFHPGGIDFDGRYIWIPVTKYYPYSGSFIARVDINTHKVEKMAYIDDSIGAIVHDTDNNLLICANWDADEFLSWHLDSKGRISDSHLSAAERRTPNTAQHLAIQDSKYIGSGKMVGFGLKRTANGSRGGLDIIDTRTFQKLRSLDIELRTSRRKVFVTGNPSTIEIAGDKMRLYFAPEDNITTLYIYQTDLKK